MKLRCSCEQTYSLQFQVLNPFQNLLGTEDVTETIARVENLNSRLIDMQGALQREQASLVKAGGFAVGKEGRILIFFSVPLLLFMF